MDNAGDSRMLVCLTGNDAILNGENGQKVDIKNNQAKGRVVLPRRP
jgi:hypothetical protein